MTPQDRWVPPETQLQLYPEEWIVKLGHFGVPSAEDFAIVRSVNGDDYDQGRKCQWEG